MDERSAARILINERRITMKSNNAHQVDGTRDCVCQQWLAMALSFVGNQSRATCCAVLSAAVAPELSRNQLPPVSDSVGLLLVARPSPADVSSKSGGHWSWE